MAKVRIPVEQLTPPNQDGDHVFQFRIISEDRNRISAWSNLYTIKSIGQYRPFRPPVTDTLESGSGEPSFTITWETPTIYNYSSSLASASIAHNHSINFKQHPTDIFLRWYNGTNAGNFEYHDRVNSDTTTINKSTQNVGNSGSGPTNVEIVGLISTYGLDYSLGTELNNKINTIKNYLAVFDININLSSGALTYVLQPS
jgi:hypothetical protein